MNTHQTKIDRYSVVYMTGGNESPSINCFDGQTYVAKLVFHDLAGPLPPNAMIQLGGRDVLYLRYRLGQFADVIDILRNEKPLFLQLTTPSLIGFLATKDLEPVGEAEL